MSRTTNILGGGFGCLGVLVLFVLQAGLPTAAAVWGYRNWGGFWGSVLAAFMGTVVTGVLIYGTMILYALIADALKPKPTDSPPSEAR